MGRMTLITGGERRRRWSDEDRARILAAVEAPGAVLAEVSRREDVCTSLIYQWRRDARAEANVAGFSEVVLANAPRASMTTPALTNQPEHGGILVELNGARIQISANTPSAVIAATLKALRS